MIRDSKYRLMTIAAICFGLVPLQGFAFDSGSTGADGAFNPTVSTEIQLPPSGVFNFTSVNIPSGVTITFRRNAANTPVVMLVQGDAVIAGSIQLNGTNDSTPTGRAGDGNLADDGQPGRGGPGGFDGGWGAPAGGKTGGNGLGPGGGHGGVSNMTYCGNPASGGGGGFGGGGSPGSDDGEWRCRTPGGSSYGTAGLLPLVGGSGGGGGASWLDFSGSGGGGGGGALLIAVSGTLTLSGTIIANGSCSAQADLSTWAGRGGCGSGGAVRLVATTLAGVGSINALGSPSLYYSGGGSRGGAGRVRLEVSFRWVCVTGGGLPE